MMSYLFYMIFVTPLFSFYFWYSYQFIYMFFLFLFMISSSEFNLSSISYLFGIDYISYSLIILSFYIISLMNLASLMLIGSSSFLFINHSICFLLLIIFSSINMLLMYISFEFILIPLMILILGWGYQPERLRSGIYLFFYTLFGSLPLFIFILFLYNDFYMICFIFEMSFNFNFILHISVIIPFLVKFPMFMLHFWLPKAHVQAPISGSMILAGLMLKIGGYGLIRFIYLNELFFFNYSYIWFSLGLLGSLLVSLICLIQVDLKCLIAYSSVSHMSLCMLGILTMSKIGLLGSLIMMLSHGLCSSGLFCLANFCYLRVNSRSLYLIKGMIFFMPSMSIFWFLFSSFNMGCPPSINFLSELMIIISCICYYDYSYYYLFFSSFFCACFCFYLYSYSQHGMFSDSFSYSNIFVSEFLLLINHLYPLILLLFWFIIF
uniref:NADH-ubiquinone oxidoreductase chain 4 n=2 Tax=Tricentrus TaxID=104884 RepID=A0A343KJ78_9HEMI|nr:NADH dehydrogenase subunit 4 [Tricentrus brunneus]ATG83183.1 NADH dehydrogenase subunit 4 [Tricentrus sp. EMHAU-15062504]QEG98468.1 NADH dehydrogenase subunit 4 [Tricentrus brunneus]